VKEKDLVDYLRQFADGGDLAVFVCRRTGMSRKVILQKLDGSDEPEDYDQIDVIKFLEFGMETKRFAVTVSKGKAVDPETLRHPTSTKRQEGGGAQPAAKNGFDAVPLSSPTSTSSPRSGNQFGNDDHFLPRIAFIVLDVEARS